MSLRRAVLRFYKQSIERVVSEIEERGYITSKACESLLQDEFAKYERFYAKRDIEPFSEEFVLYVFDKFLEKIRKIPRIRVRNIEDEPLLPGFVGSEIFSFSESGLEQGYGSLKKKYEECLQNLNVLNKP